MAPSKLLLGALVSGNEIKWIRLAKINLDQNRLD